MQSERESLGRARNFSWTRNACANLIQQTACTCQQVSEGYYLKSRQIHHKKAAKDVIREIKIPYGVSDLVSKAVSHIKN